MTPPSFSSNLGSSRLAGLGEDAELMLRNDHFCTHLMRDLLSGTLIIGEMGTFFIDVAVESHQQRGRMAQIARVLVDTGAEATWLPREVLQSLGVVPESREQYQMADGRVLERELGYVIVHVAGKRTSDDVVFAEPGDLSLLGARSLEGLNLRVDARAKRLVPAGPRITAAA